MARSVAINPWFYGFCRRFIWLVLRLRLPVKAEGMRNIPDQGGVLIAANHASYLDPPLIGGPVTHRRVRFLARDTLFHHPVSAWLFPRIGVVPMSREKGDVGAIKTALTLLKQGECVALFPEGTRTLDGTLQAAKGGIGFLIGKASVPVVPVYIEGAFEAYPKGARGIRRHPIRVRYGAPIPVETLRITGSDGKPDYQAIADLVMRHIAELRGNPA
jgi:1-acyl-sn-glycerol-3-phosphate acyltransferase